jgi:endoglucanase
MKKRLGLTVLAVLLGAGLVTSAHASSGLEALITVKVIQTSTEVLIDDFEDGNTLNNLGGYWYTYLDASSTVYPTPFVITHNPGQGAGGSNYYARVTGTVGASGYVGLGTGLGGTKDLSAYAGIQMSVRGDGHTYRLQMVSTNITNYDYYAYTFTTTGSWQTVYILFSQFSSIWLPSPDTLANSLKVVTDFQWATVNAPMASFDLRVDNVYLFY